VNPDGPVTSTTNKYVRAGASPASPIEGAWRTVAIATTGPNGTTNSSPQPGVRLYVDGHYSVLQLTRPRGQLPASNATDEELVAVWGALTANAGTYEVAGDTVRSLAMVAMNPAVMARTGPTVRTYRLQGDTLWLTQVANADGPIANPTTETYVRAGYELRARR
jgi:hypothetical protein